MINPKSRNNNRTKSRRSDQRRSDQRRDPKTLEAAAKKSRLESWTPKTEIGIMVKSKEITDIDSILNKGLRIIESEIPEALLELKSELLLIGQSKGKFGGGQRRVFRQTQKKTREGNKPKFSTMCVVGDSDGHIGIGFGKSKETVPAREKSARQAKLNIFKIRRGCGSWQCNCGEPHTVPFEVEGKCGSVIIRLIPAPKGKGLCVESEVAKILAFAGIKDCWSKTFGQTKNRINLITATEKALRKLSTTKVREIDSKNTSIVDHSINTKKKEKVEEKINIPKVEVKKEEKKVEKVVKKEKVEEKSIKKEKKKITKKSPKKE